MKNYLKKLLDRIPALLNNEEIRILDAAIHRNLFFNRESFYPEQQHYAYWERQAYFWDRNPPPVRPSKEDIRIYDNFLKRKDQKKHILILGSTPELRDLVSREANAKTYVADFSFSMPVAMLKFAENPDLLREKWIKDSWLELPFPQKFFDIILGDVVLHQITPDLEQALLEKMKVLLKDDGFFITRLFFLNEKFLKEDLNDITERILAGPYTYQQKSVLLRLQTVWLFADLTKRKFNRRLSAERFSEVVKKKKPQDPLLNEVYDSLVNDRDSYRDWSPPEEKELMRLLSPYFHIKDRATANDYLYAEYFPIFLLTPK